MRVLRENCSFDVKLPIDIDDEYWDPASPTNTYVQPYGNPTKISFFNLRIKLTQIQTFALRTLYSINKSKAILGYRGDDWERRIVTELDSVLNRWVDSIPDHRKQPFFPRVNSD